MRWFESSRPCHFFFLRNQITLDRRLLFVGVFVFAPIVHLYRKRSGMASANGYQENQGLASSITRATEGLWTNLSK